MGFSPLNLKLIQDVFSFTQRHVTVTRLGGVANPNCAPQDRGNPFSVQFRAGLNHAVYLALDFRGDHLHQVNAGRYFHWLHQSYFMPET
jgi:hypothetical protein